MSKLWKTIALASVFTVVGATFWYSSSRARKALLPTQEPSSSTNSSGDLTFRLNMIFDGRTNDGERAANSFYKASDCTPLSKVVIFFNSVRRAQQELVSEREKASAVVEQTAMTNSEGLQVGDRVVLTFDDHEGRKPHTQVVWTSDKDFHSISGPSLQHVLQFEDALTSRSGRISTQIEDVQKVTFTESEVKKGKLVEGFDYSEQQFRSSDCETVIVRTDFFPSAERAREELKEKLKSATTILEKGPRVQATTQTQEERVVAMFTAPPDSEQLEYTIVLWINDSELHSIRGTMVHALEFERRNIR